MAHEIDYDIKGAEMQFVEIELDPEEAAIAEAGSMMFKDASIEMDSVFGDGSEGERGTGIFGRLVGAGKRLITGESLFTTVFTNEGKGKARVAFAAPYPGRILAVPLEDVGGALICQKDAFLCAARGVSVGKAGRRWLVFRPCRRHVGRTRIGTGRGTARGYWLSGCYDTLGWYGSH